MGKTFKDRKDVNKNYKEISKLKRKEKSRRRERDDFLEQLPKKERDF